MKVEVDVDGVDSMFRDFERDFHRGLERAADKLAGYAKDEMRTVIRENDAIFNREVYQSFRVAETRNSKFHVTQKVHNTAPHAGALDKGVEPSEYAGGGPPVQALLPWVERKMGGWDFGFDDKGGGGNTTTVNFDTPSGSSTVEVPDSGFKVYTGGFVPQKDEFFIGQRLYLGNQLDGYSGRAEVVDYSIETDQNIATVTVDWEYRGTDTLNVDNLPSDYTVLGAEDITDITDERFLDSVKTKLESSPSEIEDEENQRVIETLTEGFYSKVRDRSEAALTAAKFKEFQTADKAHIGGSSKFLPNSSNIRRSDGYRIKYNTPARRSTIIHENIHGWHQAHNINNTPGSYADWPHHEYDDEGNVVSKKTYHYADFSFNRDGSSNTDEDPMENHLLVEYPREKPLGSDKVEEVYDILHENFGQDITYSEELDFDELLNPDNNFLSVGDAVKIKYTFDSGKEHIDEYVIKDTEPKTNYKDDPPSYVYDIAYLDNGGNADFKVNADGTPHDENMEVIGAAQTDISYELPVDESLSDRDQLIEAVNLAWMKIAHDYTQSRLDNGGRHQTETDDFAYISRPYSLRSPAEVLTTLSEVMLSDEKFGRTGAFEIGDLYENYPKLLEAWLNVFEPSEEAKVELDKLGVDY